MSSTLFVARRLIFRERTRTLALFAVAAGVIFLLTAGLVSFNTIAASAEQKNAGFLSADLELTVGVLPGHASQTAKAQSFAEDLLRARYGSATQFDTMIQAVGMESSPGPGSDAGAGAGTAVVTYAEFDTRRLDPNIAYDLLSGRYPKRSGEVALAPSVADQLHASIGSTVSLALSRRPVTVVGIARVREVHSTALVLAAPGTWASNISGAAGVSSTPAIFRQLYVAVPAVGQRILAQDFSAGADSVPYAADLQRHSISISGSRAEPIRGFRTFWVKNTVPFTVPTVAMLAAIVIGQCLLRLRRDLHLVGSLQALGFSRHQTTSVLAVSNLVPTFGGTAAGLLLGLLATLPWRAAIAGLADTDPSTDPTPWLAIIVGVAIFIAVSTAGIAVLSAQAAGQKALAVQSVQFVERQVVQRSLAPLYGVAIVLALVTAAWWLLKPGDGDSGLIRAALFCATLVAVVPLAMVAAGRLLRPTWLAGWIATRIVRSEIARVVGIVAVAGFGLSAPLGLVMLQSSYTATATASYHPSIPADQVVVLTQRPLDAAAGNALDRAAGEPGIVQTQIQTNGGDEVWASPNPQGRFGPLAPMQITVVANQADAAVDLGWQIPERDWRAVASGKVLWLDHESAPKSRTVTFASYDGQGRPHPLATASAAVTSGVPTSTALHDGGAVISEAAATRIGLNQVPFWRRYPGADNRLNEIVRTASVVGIASTDVRTDPGPAIVAAPMSFKTALVLGLVLVGVGIFLVLAPAGRESRATSRTLHAIGLSPRLVRRLHLLTNLTALLLGCAVGVVAGLGVFLANFLTSSTDVANVPWSHVGLATGGVLLVGVSAVAVSWLNLLATPGPPRAGRSRA